jgi:GntR family transcriptional regulator
MIEYHLDSHSGLAPYLQIVQQVKQALRLGLLEVGDQLPTVRQAVAQLAINPNTVLKAYRELEHEGLVASRPGQGIFVQRSLVGPGASSQAALGRSLARWLHSARAAGLDEESILALFHHTFQSTRNAEEETA